MAERLSERARQRAQAAERAALIVELGWAPEIGAAEDRYVATSAELRQALAERGPVNTPEWTSFLNEQDRAAYQLQ